MGKPFKKELEKVFEVYDWTLKQPKNDLLAYLKTTEKPIIIVGSGGSLSACHYLTLLLHSKGLFAKPATPLELYYLKNSLNGCNIIFLSASGKNTDILFGFKLVMQYEPNAIISICMKNDSPLARLSKQFSNTKILQYNLPSGKDGFLATNSLVAFYSILYQEIETLPADKEIKIDSNFCSHLDQFSKKISKDNTLQVLFGGWGQSVAVDIESKFTEAALGNILLSDYRNFGHGRHHWFAKREKSAIVALVTPREEMIAKKTLSILPSDIPHLIIKTNYDSSFASLDLLIKSFYLVDKMGAIQNIDPGRPGVPEYGSKLYNLKYTSFYKTNDTRVSKNAIASIVRKANIKNISDLSESELSYWLEAYNQFLKKLTRTRFCSIIFDYDGTLCSLENRFKELSKEIFEEINKLLSNGLILGIVTGRGKSAREQLQKGIPKKLWKNVIIGYYNGSEITTLNDNNAPHKDLPRNEAIEEVNGILSSYKYPFTPDIQIRPSQLTIEIKDKIEWTRIKPIIIHLIMKSGITGIQVLESNHSIDIISKPQISKLNIIPVIEKKAKDLGLKGEYLCIGDKGVWPGNDFELLSTRNSLSVDEVSPDTESCWNISDAGIKNDQATLEYLKKLKIIDKSVIYVV
jgi:HAD superfamily hydrolase (TIGR01484 family)